MKAFKTLAVFVLTAAFLLDCSRMESGGIVLCGDIIGNPGEVVILSYLPGQSIGYHYPEVKDGKFEFSLDNVEGFSDLMATAAAMASLEKNADIGI